ncbi:MAG TPA: amidase family protein, partial [Puia sp.]|nr:amidase family protein [Puia sp.]
MGLNFQSIEAYHVALKTGTVSCEQAVTHYLAAIGQQKDLNAFLRVYDAEALDEARALDRRRKAGEPMGKLHGVVIGIKDVIAYKGHGLTAASRILENYTSIYNATAVEKLLAEEAIIIGALNCD